MNIQLTSAGVQLLQANTGPVIVDKYKLGSGVNYVPNPSDTNIHGSTVWQGVPSQPQPVDPNTYLYSIYLDYGLGPFDFGEVGLYVGTTLFALGSANMLVHKLPLTSSSYGNSIRLDIYLQVQGTDYNIWLNPIVSDNDFRIAVVPNVDALPLAALATPNTYIVRPDSGGIESCLAYCDRQNLWSFSEYGVINEQIEILSATTKSITVNRSLHDQYWNPMFLGQVIVQPQSGQAIGAVRSVTSVIDSDGTSTINLATPLAVVPATGDTFAIYRKYDTFRTVSPTQYVLPPATTTKLGGVIVGTGLNVVPNGTLSAKVTSVAGRDGNVILVAADITNLAKVGATGLYDDLVGRPNLATVAISGDYRDLKNTPNITPFTLAPATTSVLGGIIVGAGLAITADGTLSAASQYVLPVATTTVLGGVKQGAGVTINGTGVLAIAPASATVVGGVKQGTGVSIAADGTLSLGIASATVLGGIKVGAGLQINATTGVLDSLGNPYVSIDPGNAPAYANAGSQTGGVAIGANSSVPAGSINGVAVGKGATTAGEDSVGIGANSVGAWKGVAVGSGAQSQSYDTVAIGYNALAGANDSIVIGANTQASSVQGIVIGSGAQSQSSLNVVIGSAAKADVNSGSAVVIGANASTIAGKAIVVGLSASVTSADGIAIGDTATATNGIAIGKATTAADQSVAIGGTAIAYAGTVAIGQKAQANASQSTVIGNGANNASGSTSATVVGYNASCGGLNGTVIGQVASIGTGSNMCTVVGENAAAVVGSNIVVMGAGAGSASDDTVVIGAGTAAKYAGNTIVGKEAAKNSTGDTKPSTIVGYQAGQNSGGGGGGTYLGYQAGQNSGSVWGVYIGHQAGQNAKGGIAIGYQAGQYNTSGAFIAIGNGALNGSQPGGIQGNGCIAIGDSVMGNTTTPGSYNVGIGSMSMVSGGGTNNVAVGYAAMANGGSTSNTVAIGYNAGASINQGTDNICIGYYTGIGIQLGKQNTIIGSGAYNLSGQDYSNTTCLGYNAQVTGSNQIQLGNSATTTYVYGTVQNRSDLRDKKDVRDTVLDLQFIRALRPVDYKWDLRESYIDTVEEEYEVERRVEHADRTEVRKETHTRLVNRVVARDGSRAGKRFHHGFIAQEVKALLETRGHDFGGFQDHSLTDGQDVMSIGYDEFVAPIVRAIQQLADLSDTKDQQLDQMRVENVRLKAQLDTLGGQLSTLATHVAQLTNLVIKK